MSAPLAPLANNAASAAAVAAATPPIAAWRASVGQSQLWVGSAWILSSALLTTYSTTAFLKYRGEDKARPGDPVVGAMGATLPTLGSILNSGRDSEPPQRLRRADAQAPLGGAPLLALSRASLLTLYRFSGSLLLGLVLHPRPRLLPRLLLPRLLRTLLHARPFLLPALLLFVANHTNAVALDRLGISLTYTSKCAIPLVTVLLTLAADGPKGLPPPAALAALLPIAAGVGAASWNSPAFERTGFAAALASTTSQAALNVASQRVMRRTGVRGAEAQRAMVLVALGIGVATTLVGQLRPRDGATSDAPSPLAAAHPPPWLTGLAVLAYHAEYVLSFSFVGLVAPVSYGAADALRRLLIIVTGRCMFGGDAFSRLNAAGILTALLGALGYSIASAAR